VLVVRKTSVLVPKSFSVSSYIIPNEQAAFFRLVASLSKANVVQVGRQSTVRASFWWRSHIDSQRFHLEDVLEESMRRGVFGLESEGPDNHMPWSAVQVCHVFSCKHPITLKELIANVGMRKD